MKQVQTVMPGVFKVNGTPLTEIERVERRKKMEQLLRDWRAFYGKAERVEVNN
ncbi:hypothetical protein [Alkalihalophilus marmarensis]|uniref:hypothetical protein n=1 Tax=Alkalihalophilus marmarensis TaxID=521377 RepID=UPI002E2444F9|nr:hypothetical protein [Alkalihalophilus marmarensis]